MSARTTSTTDDQPRLFFAIGGLLVLLLAAILSTDGQSVFLAVGGYTVESPHVCPFRQLVGLECAGCGLTRSFIALADGEWAQAWAFNRVGPVLFILLVLQIPYQFYALLAGPDHRTLPSRVHRHLVHSLVGLLVLNWVVEIGLMMV